MDTRKLLHFTETVDQGSISKAAQSLRISQPALTKSLRLLEKELEVELLVRSSSGVTVTEFGRSLYAHARAVEAEMEHARTEIRQLSGNGKARVKIGVLPSISGNLFARAIAQVIKILPDLEIRVYEDVHHELMAAIRRREYDFVIAMADRFEPDPGPTLRYRIVLRDQLRIIARAGHPLDGLDTVTCADLIKFPWVHPVIGAAHRPILGLLFMESGIEPPRAQVECASVQFAKTVMATSDALGLMPAHTIEPDIKAGTLCCLPIISEHLQRTVGLYYSVHRPLTPAAKAVMREIERICGGSLQERSLQPELV